MHAQLVLYTKRTLAFRCQRREESLVPAPLTSHIRATAPGYLWHAGRHAGEKVAGSLHGWQHACRHVDHRGRSASINGDAPSWNQIEKRSALNGFYTHRYLLDSAYRKFPSWFWPGCVITFFPIFCLKRPASACPTLTRPGTTDVEINQKKLDLTGDSRKKMDFTKLRQKSHDSSRKIINKIGQFYVTLMNSLK